LNAIAPRLRSELLSQRLTQLSDRLHSLWRLAELAHPDRPLRRGFARVTSRDGRTLTHASDAIDASTLTLHFGDGNVDATVDEPGARPPVERKPRRSYVALQPGLFDRQED
jgi:exodeoxyribonuclease VII large subunit